MISNKTFKGETNNLEWQLRMISQMAENRELNFFLPPFEGDVNEAALDIDHLVKDDDKDAISSIAFVVNSVGLEYEYAKAKDRMFMAIKLGNKG